jgi:histidine triad (HIT) family protein
MKKLLYSVARTSLGSVLFGWVVRTMSFLIPGETLHETELLVAFDHPSPSYPSHILIVPKKKYASLMQLDSDDTQFMQDLITCVQTLVRELGLEDERYRLVVNGGKAQEVDHLHFHLIAD